MRTLRYFALALGVLAAFACGFVQPAWSPSGTKLAFLSGDGEEPEVWIHTLADGSRQRLPAEVRGATQVTWLSDEELLAVQADAEAGDAAGLWRVRDGLASRIWAARTEEERRAFRFGVVVSGSRAWARIPAERQGSAPVACVDLQDGSLLRPELGRVAMLGAGPLGLFAVLDDRGGDGAGIRRVVEVEGGFALEPFADLRTGPAGIWLDVGARHVAVLARGGAEREAAPPRALVFDPDGETVCDVVLPFPARAGFALLGPGEETVWIVTSNPRRGTGDGVPAAESEPVDPRVTRVRLADGDLTTWEIAELAGGLEPQEEVLGARIAPHAPLLAVQCVSDERGFVRLLDFRGEAPTATVLRASED